MGASGYGHGMGFGGVFMWIFWIVLILLVVWAVASLFGGRGGGRGREEKTALEILEARYARGEIEREEFERKRRDLIG